ncbi:uncharacterized protein Dana_GF17872 [Drosophila ananassae]|uniref:Uncharacterized protein n=1 Tax=Drosophila ananassae TaxID=7217 RepID=B3M1W2_DROAN|nr:uncharacterized protein LOC6500655 [Drosophila ananassae]EDV42222.1 uncharacterized protein Dana_GF17872 [Drosophila ananassae]
MELPIPEAQYWDVTKSAQKEREVVRDFIPKGVPLNIVNYAELFESDTFFLECQKYRDFYRDPYAKVHCPKFFELYKGKCGVKLDHTLAVMLKTMEANEDSLPILYPLIVDRSMRLGKGFGMTAQHSPISSSVYKR